MRSVTDRNVVMRRIRVVCCHCYWGLFSYLFAGLVMDVCVYLVKSVGHVQPAL